MSRARSIDRVLADPHTPADLADRLRLVVRLRDFARDELRLPVDGHYRSYADLQRPYVVWNVSATPEFSLTAKSWWYPIVGALDYRGYFSEQAARKLAARLEHDGYDVHVGGVQAYSTLGWLRDPVLNTFIRDEEAELADTLFHELAHQRVFAAGDTDFDEAFATSVAREGVRRWIRSTRDAAALEEYERSVVCEIRFMELVAEAREKLARLFPPEPGRGSTEEVRGASHLMALGVRKARDSNNAVTPIELRSQKAAIYRELQEKYQKVRKEEWGGNGAYDGWFSRPLNNARLNDIDTYYRLVPAFESLLSQLDGDLEKFYQRVEKLARLDQSARLKALTATNP
jgi:predicted aminopeptidase